MTRLANEQANTGNHESRESDIAPLFGTAFVHTVGSNDPKVLLYMNRTLTIRRRLLAAGLAALSLIVAASARAEEPGLDEVTLKNGGSIRGTVVTSEPGTSVKVLEIGQREPRVIPWSQVSDVERGKYAPKVTAQPGLAGPGYGGAPLPPAPQVPPPPEPKLGTPGVVRLHIDSPAPVRLFEVAGVSVGVVGGYSASVQHLRPVCGGTCDRVIDGSEGQSFAVTGAFPAPPAFSLGSYQGDVSLRVQPGSLGRRIGGVTLITLGGLGVLLGAALLPLALGDGVLTTPGSTNSSLTHGAAGTLAVGAVALAGGIALVVTSSTKIALQPRVEVPAGNVAQSRPRYWLGEF